MKNDFSILASLVSERKKPFLVNHAFARVTPAILTGSEQQNLVLLSRMQICHCRCFCQNAPPLGRGQSMVTKSTVLVTLTFVDRQKETNDVLCASARQLKSLLKQVQLTSSGDCFAALQTKWLLMMRRFTISCESSWLALDS